MLNRIATDPRIDPRIKAVFGSVPTLNALGDNIAWGGTNVATREQLLHECNTALAERQATAALWQTGLDLNTRAADVHLQTFDLSSNPDRNTIKLCLIRPPTTAPLPCVYYIHGGGMASGSCFDPIYQLWGKTIASHGVAVAMVDFRNCVIPSSVPDIAPYPPDSTIASPVCTG
jgi:acetyl esterase